MQSPDICTNRPQRECQAVRGPGSLLPGPGRPRCLCGSGGGMGGPRGQHGCVSPGGAGPGPAPRGLRTGRPAGGQAPGSGTHWALLFLCGGHSAGVGAACRCFSFSVNSTRRRVIRRHTKKMLPPRPFAAVAIELRQDNYRYDRLERSLLVSLSGRKTRSRGMGKGSEG